MTPGPDRGAGGEPRRHYAALALLFAISLLQYVDRWSVAAVLNELQKPAAADGGLDGGFGLSDTAAGLVSTVFVFTYMVLSPVFGYLGDRVPRIPLIFCGSVLYAASVFCGSYARYYSQFLMFRSLVGVGEASFAVLAPALVADWFPAGAERTNALGFFCVSQPLGAAAGFVYAGEVSRLLGWRYAFRLSPFLSFALSAVLLLTVAEPDRGGVDGVAPAAVRATDNSAAKASWVRDVRAILGTRSFFLSTIGAVGMTFTSGAIAQWAPAYMQRVSCVTSDDDCAASVTRTFGLVTMATGVIGTVTGSQVARWYAKRNHAADAVVCALGLLLATPCVYAAIYLAPVRPGTPTWTAVFLGEVLVSMVWAPNTAILLSVVSAHRRSTATSISLLTTHLFGDSMSPVLIGACADWLHASTVYKMSKAVSLQYALYLSVVSTVVGSVFFMAAGAHLEGDRARAVIGYEPVDSGAASDTTVVAQSEADPPGGESKRGGRGAVFTLLDDSPRDGTAVAAAAAARSGRSGLSSMHCLAASASPPRR